MRTGIHSAWDSGLVSKEERKKGKEERGKRAGKERWEYADVGD